ncbi:MAG: glyoxalase [Eubacteriales bacterium]
MQEFDEVVLACFVKKQLQLFPEKVANNREEAEVFLEEGMAVVLDGPEEVWEYFEEQGIDLEGMSQEDLLLAEEVFTVGDGRYLIVEG